MAKILLIEDDPHLSVNIRDWLTFERHNVDIAENGDIGMDYLKSSTYDLIILDWELPELPGIEVCIALSCRAIKPPASGIVFIVTPI